MQLCTNVRGHASTEVCVSECPYSVFIADAVQRSSFNKLAGWHSDERWSELIITCSFTDISQFM